MKLINILFLNLLWIVFYACTTKQDLTSDNVKNAQWSIIIHGGAGSLSKESLSLEADSLYRNGLSEALNKGIEMLQNDAPGLDVVVEVIKLMESNPIFNAGRGSVLNNLGQVEMDASIMDGSTLDAGAVASLQHIVHPIEAARLVMDSSKHVLLSSSPAEEFCLAYQLDSASNDYFLTDKALRALKRSQENSKKFGTVGVVVRDGKGHISAGTSTGGMTNKRYGRIGDAPIIGAGTYANDATCGVSCTGHGEMFIRLSVAHELSAMLEHTDLTIQEAIDIIIDKKLPSIEGKGGLIAIDRNGKIAFGFNTRSMLRAFATPGHSAIEIY